MVVPKAVTMLKTSPYLPTKSESRKIQQRIYLSILLVHILKHRHTYQHHTIRHSVDQVPLRWWRGLQLPPARIIQALTHLGLTLCATHLTQLRILYLFTDWVALLEGLGHGNENPNSFGQHGCKKSRPFPLCAYSASVITHNIEAKTRP